MTNELFALLDKEGAENRTATIAALIIERCREPVADAPAGLVGAPLFNPQHAERIARTLTGLAERIKHLAEAECNHELTPAQERNAARFSDRFHAIAKGIGFGARTTGDPRGPVCFLIDPEFPDAGDGWAGGWPVYR